MTDTGNFEEVLRGRKVFVTGHTGFTGGWACLWLRSLGATVAGYALLPDTTPSLFAAADIASEVPGTFGDICDYAPLLEAMQGFEPELVLHLAAQPLVRRSYCEPLRTFLVNAQGSMHRRLTRLPRYQSWSDATSTFRSSRSISTLTISSLPCDAVHYRCRECRAYTWMETSPFTRR